MRFRLSRSLAEARRSIRTSNTRGEECKGLLWDPLDRSQECSNREG